MDSRKCSIHNIEMLRVNKKFIKPDGGYGYVILFVGFVSHFKRNNCFEFFDLKMSIYFKTISFILDGCMYGFGIILDEIKNHYKVTQDLANLISSLNLGISFMTGMCLS